MKKHFYAVGNFGDGAEIVAFVSKKERDNFVAWGEADNRHALSRVDAKKYSKTALILPADGPEQRVNL